MNHSSEWPSKILVIGLDGATFDLLKPWAAQGELPYLKKLMDTGVSRVLQSVIPPISAGAWSSFMTGQNPGKHGVFGFRTYDLRHYTCFNERLVNSSYIAGRTFVDILGKHGYQVAMICVPLTYPVWPINGIMVAGFPTPEFGNYTWPVELAARLGIMSIPGDFHTYSPAAKLERSLAVLENRTALALETLRDPRYKVTIVVLSAPDDAHHHFWKFMDPHHPSYNARSARRYGHIPLELYKRCDDAVGRMLACLDEDALVVVMSDHGGGPSPTCRFNTNAWLHGAGWLRLKSGRSSQLSYKIGDVLYTIKEHLPFKEHIRRALPVKTLSHLSSILMNITNIDWPHTRAYRVPMYATYEGIEINLRGRQPEGCVQPGEEYEQLLRDIQKQLLESYGSSGKNSAIKAVYRKEEIYAGGYLDNAPDLVIEFRDDYTGAAGLQSPVISAVPRAFLDVWSGTHRRDGILIANGRFVRQGVTLEDASIMDLAPTILYALGMLIPEDMDGQVLFDMFVPEFTAQREARYTAPMQATYVVDSGLTSAEEEDIVARLRGMGYM